MPSMIVWTSCAHVPSSGPTLNACQRYGTHLSEIFIIYDAHNDIKATSFYVVGICIKSSLFFHCHSHYDINLAVLSTLPDEERLLVNIFTNRIAG